MADCALLDCVQSEPVQLERVHYFPRQLLTADDMTADQDYVRQKLRRHNRFLHGWGVVCGLEVTAAPTPDAPWRVHIAAGYALGPYGDEIYVAEAVFLDLAHCGPGAATNPCEPSLLLTQVAATSGSLFVAIKYAECVARPVRAMPAGCACDETACEYSRIRDSFQLECLTTMPASHQLPLLCDLRRDHKLPPCPPCPTEPWVVLAQVSLPAPGTSVVNTNINNFVRRQLYSTAMLQEQLIACCCQERPSPAVADVAVTAEASPSEGLGFIAYAMTVRNNGPGAAHNVVVEDTPPVDILSARNFSAQWTQTATPPYVANLGTLGPSQAVTLTFEVVVRSGTYINIAKVTSDTSDPNMENNTAMTETLFIEPPR